MTKRNLGVVASVAASALFFLAAAPALAQEDTTTAGPATEDAARPGSVYDGDWISLGIGVGYGPSYDGSDDYAAFPAPLIQGSVGGIGIKPRPAGIAFDLLPSAASGPDFSFGPSLRYRANRSSQIKDPVVKAAGELDAAFEVGAAAGISFPAVLNPYDSLSVSSDVRWDVAGAHGGMVVEPSVSYFTPLNRGVAASLSFSAEYASDDFNDYYYTVTPTQSLASGLPAYQADGGFNKVGTNLLLGFDLDGNLENGGFAAVLIGGYSRMLGEAKNTPYTSIRGSADQFFTAVGIGYTF
ncbi:MipA/OmpV family protein [Altererythrobacter confluentis]|uniref:MipA/OmpV family protein n=1 Tax=Allopontixanthobacter confluentis TaxID=1849021 RepID=A0A6L7GG66_9SPHN|nr:MipA/OmpV family protein [Allopontixanthobacter confluentis]MXP14867.1 MipA/OmpV family protein [Allopontixanthobacter confluentis]